MTGYRTIPTKDTFDVDEKLGGLLTVKQLAYIIIGAIATYAAFTITDPMMGSDSIYVWGSVAFFAILFTFTNADRWIRLRIQYYILSDHNKLERNPALLRNIRSIEEDKIITLDGRVIAILKVTPINFPLLSEEAKEAKISAYEMYLRQLVYPIMHLVQSEKVDAQQYYSQVSAKAATATTTGLRGLEEYTSKHISFMKRYLKDNNSRAKQHYVVLQVQDPRYKEIARSPKSTFDVKVGLIVNRYLTEFKPQNLIFGGKLMGKPRNHVRIDTAGSRMIFEDEQLMPNTLPARSKKVGPVLQFESKAAMLRYASTHKKRYYLGAVDVDELLRKEFRDMTLKEREKEFTVEERRKHVHLSGGKTRWSFDEGEKHIAVLADKLEATGLRVHRLRGEELLSGRHSGFLQANKIKISPKAMKVDNTIMKVIFATGYPYQVNLGWLTNIVDGREDYDLTMYIYPVGINEAISTFRTAILKLSTEKKARADFLDPEKEQNLEDIRNFYTQIVSGKEKYFLSSLYITAKADSMKSLDTVLEKCKSDLAGASIDYEVADFNMAKAVYSTRLTGTDLLGKKREFPASSHAATFPHIASSVEIDPDGIFFGFDAMNAPVIIDLTKLTNQHMSITGESGSGKSYFAKSIVPHYLISGYKVYVTDPDGEYVKLAQHFGGTVTTVGPTRKGSHINPFDLSGREVNDKIRSVLGLFSIICGSLNKYQEGIINEVLIELFDQSLKDGKQITMSDVQESLKRMIKSTKDEQVHHDAQFLLMAIRPFIKGNIYGFVDAPTTIDLDTRMQVFDLREYQNDKTLKDFFNYIIFDFITHKLLKDKSKKALIMDEGWTMVNYPGSEEYVQYIIKDSRKYNVSFVFITQELEDMLNSRAGRSIMNNTATQFMFHQKESAMNLMKTTLNLTDIESERLLACAKGEGLMISGKNRLFFKISTSPEEHKVITTDPNEGKVEKKAQRPQAVQAKAPAALDADSSTKEANAPTATSRPIAQKSQMLSPALSQAMAENPELQDLLDQISGDKRKSLPIALTHGAVDKEEAKKMLKLQAESAKEEGKRAQKGRSDKKDARRMKKGKAAGKKR